MADRREELIKSEKRAIELARATQLAEWQIRTAYYLAMVNNKAMAAGSEPVTFRLLPGKPPKIEMIK